MRKIHSLFTLLLLVLLLSSCGNDEPSDNYLYAYMSSFNYVVNQEDSQVTLSNGTFYFTINTSTNKATMEGTVKINEESSVHLQLANLNSTYTQGGYILTLPSAMVDCGDGHFITKLQVRIDARSSISKNNYIAIEFDEQYNFYGYLSTMLFENSVSEVGHDAQRSDISTINDGAYSIALDIENDMADLTIADVYSTASGKTTLTFRGLHMDANADGLVISMPEGSEGIRDADRSEVLKGLNLTVNMQEGRFELSDCQIANGSDIFYIYHATGNVY